MPGSRPNPLVRALRAIVKIPIYVYRYTLSALIGRTCRHLPTCSQFALEAIDMNGVWRGGWQSLARFWRCRPGGTHGYDPVEDLTGVSHPIWVPWRYGRWR